jgi:hypothetical protein
MRGERRKLLNQGINHHEGAYLLSDNIFWRIPGAEIREKSHLKTYKYQRKLTIRKKEFESLTPNIYSRHCKNAKQIICMCNYCLTILEPVQNIEQRDHLINFILHAF